MKNLLKLGLVVFGFTLATIATSNDVKAESNTNKMIVEPAYGGCVGSGDCGTTREGTRLVGKWREL